MKTKYLYASCFILLVLLVVGCASSAPSAPVSASARSLDVITAFRSAGLMAEVIQGASKDERDGLSPFMVIDTRRFRISANDEEMGMVLSFANRYDMEQLKNYYLRLNRSLPQFGSWLFVKDNILLQINHEVPESKARAYAAVLYTLDQ